MNEIALYHQLFPPIISPIDYILVFCTFSNASDRSGEEDGGNAQEDGGGEGGEEGEGGEYQQWRGSVGVKTRKTQIHKLTNLKKGE